MINMNYLCNLMQFCETSKGVIEEFMLGHPNVKASVVSAKESRMKIRYKGIDKERGRYGDRWKKKK